jgi:hypothetical protein
MPKWHCQSLYRLTLISAIIIIIVIIKADDHVLVGNRIKQRKVGVMMEFMSNLIKHHIPVHK